MIKKQSALQCFQIFNSINLDQIQFVIVQSTVRKPMHLASSAIKSITHGVFLSAKSTYCSIVMLWLQYSDRQWRDRERIYISNIFQIEFIWTSKWTKPAYIQALKQWVVYRSQVLSLFTCPSHFHLSVASPSFQHRSCVCGLSMYLTSERVV